jgi:hypothetical protein
MKFLPAVVKTRSPDGAQRNPGFSCAAAPPPDFASLHPGYLLDVENLFGEIGAFHQVSPGFC